MATHLVLEGEVNEIDVRKRKQEQGLLHCSVITFCVLDKEIVVTTIITPTVDKNGVVVLIVLRIDGLL